MQPRGINKKGVDATLIGSDDEDYGSDDDDNDQDQDAQDDQDDQERDGDSSVVREPSSAAGSERSSSQSSSAYQPPGVVDSGAGAKNEKLCKPIRPKKTHKHGTKRWQLHELVMNTLTLGSGGWSHALCTCVVSPCALINSVW
jgi:hypothetical protein